MKKNKASATKTEAPKVASLERALSVLKVFETASEPVSLARIATDTGLYKSTILRLIASFEDFGYLRRTDNGTYALGPAAFRLGTRYREQFRLDDVLEETLTRLVENGTESASFHIRDGEHRLCIARVDSRHSTLDRVNVGDLLPLARGAAGKVIRAFSDPEPDAALDDVRTEGLALSCGEVDPACSAIAAPVFGEGGELIGAISLSGPKERFNDETIASMRTLLLQATKELSELAITDDMVIPRKGFRLLTRR